MLATPLLEQSSDAPIWRAFPFLGKIPLFQRLKYRKPPLSFDGQLALLESRGLIVADRHSALQFLSCVNYYRFSAYLHTYRQLGGDNYKPKTTFEEIAELYSFDRKLRLAISDAVERVEVWIRTAITYELAHHCGPFGYRKKSFFKKGFDHKKMMVALQEELSKSKETFVQHYRDKYTGENYLPVWMATELLTFGNLSHLYSALPLDMKQRIALQIGVADNVLASWLQSINYVRNLCAHHSRVWNRKLSNAPKVPSHKLFGTGKMESTKCYAMLVVLQLILEKTSPHSTWRDRIVSLIDENPHIDTRQMGFPADWKTRKPFGTPMGKPALPTVTTISS